jgi:predicted nucleic acid-binding Zn ribbon protein
MPIYDFLNTETGEEFEMVLSISGREEYLKNNPYIQQIIGATATVSGVSIKGKVPDGFKEVLSKVSESHKASSVAKNHGRRSSKEIATQQILEKHRNK